jgi:hypothetical protein
MCHFYSLLSTRPPTPHLGFLEVVRYFQTLLAHAYIGLRWATSVEVLNGDEFADFAARTDALRLFNCLTHIARQPDGKRAYTRLSGFRSFCLCTTDFILVKGRCLMPRVSNNCFNFCSGREHFFTDISCSALL